MQGRLLRCVECNEVVFMTEHDSSPEYHYVEKEDRFIKLVKNDRESFMMKHDNHEKEELTINEASYISDRSYSEPLKTVYFEATNGKRNFVIKRWRDKIESPVRYQLINGRIEITDIELEIHGESIRRQIGAEIDPPISENRVTQFVQVVKVVVSQLDPRTLMEDSFESDNPLRLYCKLKNKTIIHLVELSKKIFEGEELKKIKKFIYENSGYDGVIAPLVKYRFKILPSDKPVINQNEEPGILQQDWLRNTLLTTENAA